MEARGPPCPSPWGWGKVRDTAFPRNYHGKGSYIQNGRSIMMPLLCARTTWGYSLDAMLLCQGSDIRAVHISGLQNGAVFKRLEILEEQNSIWPYKDMQSSEDMKNTVEKTCLLSRDEAVATQCKRNCLRKGIKERDWRSRAALCSAVFQTTRDERQRPDSAYGAPHALKLTPFPSDDEELPSMCQARDRAILPLLSLSPNSYELGVDPLF